MSDEIETLNKRNAELEEHNAFLEKVVYDLRLKLTEMLKDAKAK